MLYLLHLLSDMILYRESQVLLLFWRRVSYDADAAIPLSRQYLHLWSWDQISTQNTFFDSRVLHRTYRTLEQIHQSG